MPFSRESAAESKQSVIFMNRLALMPAPDVLTFESHRWPGTALSREKAHSMREEVARKPMVAKIMASTHMTI